MKCTCVHEWEEQYTSVELAELEEADIPFSAQKYNYRRWGQTFEVLPRSGDIIEGNTRNLGRRQFYRVKHCVHQEEKPITILLEEYKGRPVFMY